MILFDYFRRERRKRILAEPFPEDWRSALEHGFKLYRTLTDEEKGRLHTDVQIFIAEKNWEGCGGLALSDAIKVTIAAGACYLLLGLEHDYFGRVKSVLVYPSAYRATREDDLDPLPVVHESGHDLLGEAQYRGPCILAWDEVERDSLHPEKGRNVVMHEFGHQLDFLDGLINGTPPLRTREQSARWNEIMTREYRRLIRDSEHGRATVLDTYGTTNEAEFFAVVVECFFNRPAAMQRRHPELYDLLREYFGQDPVHRQSSGQ